MLVGFSSVVPAVSSCRIVESHGVQRWSHFILGEDVGAAELAMQIMLEAEIGAGPGSCTLLQLGTASSATEEAFNRTMRDGDLAKAMKLPGARSARRYRLAPHIGRCTWESLTLFGFDGEDPVALTQALVDCADVWEGDPSCIVMRVQQGSEAL